jgi:hypothetical protein
MMPGKNRLFGMIALGVLCSGIGFPSAGVALTTCVEPMTKQARAVPTTDRLCQSVKHATEKSRGYRIAQIFPFDCFDRCTIDFNLCMGTPPRNGGPLTPIPNGDGTVRTPPPVEQCLRFLQDCQAACRIQSGGDPPR